LILNAMAFKINERQKKIPQARLFAKPAFAAGRQKQ
jgi:hypothetical protein